MLSIHVLQFNNDNDNTNDNDDDDGYGDSFIIIANKNGLDL